eukprot:CAMPEP_0115858126 /NCGR_PEP_ID=MMETSP0287-20121206/15936_1 /TAXON_ID=412157 /ORGANISM="Chrysochromulina rotalis, Strain UIO044" /LENGTH=263 /DNA_ID=CAMNT_0003312379 /DNA_START=21 /DNA_END=812 /DNA_ORIENTATION=+
MVATTASLLATASLASAAPATSSKQQPELMKLRGGSAAVTATASVLAASGAALWISPEVPLQAYGLATDDRSANLYARQVGAWYLVAAMAVGSGASGPQSAAVTTLLASALCVLACIPVNEYFDRSKPEAISGIVMMLTMAKLISTEKLGARAAAGLLCFLGLLIHFTPQDTAVLYGIQPDKTSPLLYSMISTMGSVTFLSGLYIGALALGFAPLRALGVMLLANACFQIKFAFADCTSLGASSTMPLACAAALAALAGFVLK